MCGARPPEDLKSRSSVFSCPPFFTFTTLALSSPPPPHFFGVFSSSPRPRTGRSVSAASRNLPSGPQMGCQVQGLDRMGTKESPPTTPPKSTVERLRPQENAFNRPLSEGPACMECVEHGQAAQQHVGGKRSQNDELSKLFQ